MKVMKINTLIITILKIKIEDSVLIVLIFKCLQYIDQHNPVFPQVLWGGGVVGVWSEAVQKSKKKKKKKKTNCTRRASKKMQKKSPQKTPHLSALYINVYIHRIMCDLIPVTPLTSPACPLYPDFLKRVMNKHLAWSRAHRSSSLYLKTANLEPNIFPEPLHNIPEGG